MMVKKLKNNFRFFSLFCFIFLITAVWIFSGWPRIWDNPSIPSEISKAQAAFAGGSGTSGDPYQIETWAQLNEVRNYLSSSFILMNDLSSSTIGYDTYAGSSANGGGGWASISTFTGTFDGNGHTISDIYTYSRWGNDKGLFGTIGAGAEILNLGILNISASANQGAGGLASSNYGTISNCYSTGSIYTFDNYAGGLVGYNYGGGIINNSYSTANVTTGSIAGGMTSVNRGTIINSYSTGNVAASSSVGGFVGVLFYDGIITNSFWDTETSGQATSDGGTGKTTSEMKDYDTFNDASWDIVLVGNYTSETWYIYDGNDYPRLDSEHKNLFISFWSTTSTSSGSSDSTKIKLPFKSDGVYNFIVDWGDSSNSYITTYNQAEVTHTYSSEGAYELKISGTIEGWQFYNGGDKLKILDISQWGKLKTGNANGPFYGCENLNASAIDVLDLTGTTNLAYMFANAKNFNGNVSNWDTSEVTDMRSMFYGASSFNQNIGNWDVSNVIYFYNGWYSGMFQGATAFNNGGSDSINNWDTSNSVNMGMMFYGATNFNQPIGNWNVSNVTNMNYMFRSAEHFNQDLNNWNTSKVTNMDTIFYGATDFNGNISNWDISSVTGDFSQMFYGASSFNQDIGNWDVSGATAFGGGWASGMFWGATAFNNGGSDSIKNWNTSNVTNMFGMFYAADNFNQDLSNWDTSKVTNMERMFYSANNFNGNISSWNTGSVTSMAMMFYDTAFNQDIGNWNTGNVTSMYQMFYSADNFNQNIGNWDVSNVIYFCNGWYSGMFQSAEAFNNGGSDSINNWDTSSGIDMQHMFASARAFNQPIGNWDVSNVTNMNYMFYDADIFDQDIGDWDVSNVTDMNYMFTEKTISLSTANYDSLLIGWNSLPLLQSGVTLRLGNAKYSLGLPATSRQNLIDTYNWVIIDDGTTGEQYIPFSSVSCSTNISSTSFGELTILNVAASFPNASTTMSCNGTPSGCSLYIKDSGSGSNSGLFRNSSPTYLIASTDAILSAGTEGYGVQATSTSAGLTISGKYNKINNTIGGLSLTNLSIASSTTDISDAIVIVTHKASIDTNTLSGNYSDTITYECVAN